MPKIKPGYKLVKSFFGKELEIPEEWELKKIKDITKVSVGLVINPSTYFESNGTIPMITGKNVTEKGIILDNVDYISEKNNKLLETTRIWSGDLVSMRVGYPGRTSLVKNEHDGINCASVIITRRNKKYHSQFLFYLLNSKLTSQQIVKYTAGGAQQVVNISSWNEFLIPFPQFPEQQKIADILTTIDDLINSYDEAIDLTKKLKRGLMQKLLTRGIGHTKFKKIKWCFGKEIEIPEEWELKKLDNVSKIVDSLHVTPKYSEEGYPMIRSTDIKYGNLNLTSTLQVSKEVFEEFTKKYLPKKHDVVMSRVGTYGIVSYVDTNEPFCLGQNTVVIKSDMGYFIYLSISSDLLKKQIEIVVDGSTQKTITLKNIQKLKLFVPPIYEQQKIISILSEIDSKLNKLDFKKTNLENLKKGLMQKLLTGQIRVVV